MAEALCDQLFSDVVDGDLMRQHTSDTDDLLGILEAWEDCVTGGGAATTPRHADEVLQQTAAAAAATTPPNPTAAAAKRRRQGCREADGGAKRQRCSPPTPVSLEAAAAPSEDGAANKSSHITVERNRRKQMNDHLAVLRSLMPCFYVKRGDQASIIGGVVEYIKELQQVLQSLEAKKQRKAYTEQVLSPRLPPAASCSPRPPLSPRPPHLLMPLKSTPPISPRPAAVPISPRTPPPAPSSPYIKSCRLPISAAPPAISPAMTTPTREPAAASYHPSLDTIAADLCAYAAAGNKQLQAALPAVAAGGGVVLPDVKVEFAGANLVVKTVSHRSPGQTVKVIAALEGRSLEILDAKINTVNDTAVNSYTIKIGIKCELSAEELVQEIQHAFSS